ncbi:DUF4214 domain-containing protein [Prochlorococcus marinus]|uniref:DUF4214 domain-containing protein n=1 Tax=Prochlorococcus marinus XMU1408 TaxID=2213228 RepID=A0A318R0N2_PROMR|nr:DUF4214 domain-containing protein [Prochlorococcus marinus]MBW3042877.1 hypothetical protein [Prochlorococcus marinus str. XMU1408]PYE00703.1 hypothetical protein DNJ73_09170 [Prochlorococcus marinus XMU1408]
MANATSTQLQELYVAYFGRAADPTGLDYWTEKGITTSKFAADMYAQAEFKDVYGSLSTESQVNQIYKNLFDREADVDGLNYWTLEINLGKIQLAEIANHLIYAAQNNAGSEDDKTALTNRTNAAVAYTAKVKESSEAILAFQAESTDPWVAGDNITEAISYLSGIDKDTAHTDAGIAASVTTITDNGPSGTSQTFTFTTGVDKFNGGNGADIFNANLTTNSTNTLNAFDEITGGSGLDKLYADIRTAVTPAKISGVEEIHATFSGAVTFGVTNATDLTTINNVSSTANATFTGIAAGATSFSVSDVASSTTNFGYLSTTGSQAATVALNNVTGGSDAEISIDGVETLTFNSNTAASTYEIAADAATTVNFGGAADQTVVLDATTVNISKFDASTATGDVTLTGINQTGVGGSVDLTVTGGAGNDSLTLTANTGQNLSVSGGAGDDTITNTALAITDTVDGGDGTDTIVTNNAVAIVLDNATRTTFTNVEAITINNEFDGSLSTQLIAESIDTVNLTLANANIIDSAETITGGAGSFTVNIGNTSTDANGVLAAALTVADTGSATTDSLTIANKAKTSAGANVDIFGATAFTSTGYENVTIDTGTGSGADQLDITTLTITPDSITGTAVSLTLTGTNAIDIATSLTTTATGLMTVDASGLTAQDTGTDTLVISVTAQGTSGTASITGSSGEDTIIVGNFASTIKGGDGNDSLVGGTANDAIYGGDGNDTITGSGGNDIYDGGAGDDSFTVQGTSVNLDAGSGNDTVNMDATLSSGDTVKGGAGTDILAIDSAATATSSEGVTGFETLRVDSELSQDMVQFTNNSGFTRIEMNHAGTVSITNASNTVTEFSVRDQGASDTTTFDRLLDNSSNTLTVQAHTDAATSIISLIVDDEETLTIDDGAIDSALAFVITDLHAEDLVTLNITGGSNFTITNAIQSQATAVLTTINASTNTGTVSIDADNATLGLTFTGSTTAANTLSGGAGGDTITGGGAADTLTGDGGSDSITGGDGADTLTGGNGADTILGGAGADVISAGGGKDSVTGGAGADTFRLYATASNNDEITDFDASQTDLVAFDISDIEGLTAVTDFVELDATTVAAATGVILSVNATAAVDLDSADTNVTSAAFQCNYSSASELQADMRSNLTVAATFIAGDGILVFYDDGTNTTAAIATTAGGGGNAVLTDWVVADIATFTGVTDATSIVSANLTTFRA